MNTIQTMQTNKEIDFDGFDSIDMTNDVDEIVDDVADEIIDEVDIDDIDDDESILNDSNSVNNTEKTDILELYAQIVCDCLKNTKLKNTKATLNKGNRGKKTSGMNLQTDKKANKEMDNVAYKRIPHQFNTIGNEQLDVVLKKAMSFKFKSSDTGELATQLEKIKKAKLYSQEMILREISLITRKVQEEDKFKIRTCVGDITAINSSKIKQLEEILNSMSYGPFNENIKKIKEYNQEIMNFDIKAGKILSEIESRHTDKYNRIAKTCFNILSGTHKKYSGTNAQQKFYDLIVQKYRGTIHSNNNNNINTTVNQQTNQQEQKEPVKWSRFDDTQKYDTQKYDTQKHDTQKHDTNRFENLKSNSKFSDKFDKNDKFTKSFSKFGSSEKMERKDYLDNKSKFSESRNNTFNDDGWQTQIKSKHGNYRNNSDGSNNNLNNRNNKGDRMFANIEIKPKPIVDEYPELQPKAKDVPIILGAWGKKSTAVFAPPEIKKEKVSNFAPLLEQNNYAGSTDNYGMVTIDRESKLKTNKTNKINKLNNHFDVLDHKETYHEVNRENCYDSFEECCVDNNCDNYNNYLNDDVLQNKQNQQNQQMGENDWGAVDDF